MAAVWKFQIPIEDSFSLEMPIDAELLHVAIQDRQPCLWALVEPQCATETRHFELRGTGHELDTDRADTHCVHVGSFMMSGGAIVFHLFERVSKHRCRAVMD